MEGSRAIRVSWRKAWTRVMGQRKLLRFIKAAFPRSKRAIFAHPPVTTLHWPRVTAVLRHVCLPSGSQGIGHLLATQRGLFATAFQVNITSRARRVVRLAAAVSARANLPTWLPQPLKRPNLSAPFISFIIKYSSIYCTSVLN